MSLLQVLQISTSWFAWGGIALAGVTVISFLIGWGARFRLVGATVFSFLLSGSCWAFSASYSPPVLIEGALYAPVVYDNGYDLVVAQASEDFPQESIEPTLEQIAGNLKGGGRSGTKVHVRLRKNEAYLDGISHPVVLGEVIRDLSQKTTTPLAQQENEN